MANTLANRTHTCGALRVEHEGQEVILKGWITLRREHKNIIFLDLGDRYGMTQLTLNTQEYPQLATLLPELRLGTCIGVAGTVVDREKSGGSVNKQLETGAIEVIVSHAEIYGATKDLPFPIKDEIDASDLTRLKYRYLDLRRNPIARNIQLRSKVTHAIRDYMHSQEFLEIETPILMKSTPEGARDYLVPSREEPGHFYALPQSPQLYKQLLMIAGMDKYYQIARCFRDEDLRADRQPEFTQIDLEMSFVRDKDVHNVVEGMFVHIFREAMNIELTTPFPRMTYKEAMERFGEDKPDLRYGLELIDMTSVFAESGFGAFSGKCVKGIRVPNEAGRSKSWIKKLEKFIKQRGAGGLAWFKKLDNSWEASIKYFLGDGSAELEAIEQITEAQNNDLLFVVAHEKASSVNEWLSALRRKLAETLELIDSSKYSFLWIDEFPLVEETEDENGVKQLHMLHHPFTQPHPEDIEKIETAPADIRSISYDLVLNGYELGSGSLRVFDTELQTRLLKMVGIEQEEAEERFGFFLEALKYGTPPHGGMGLGLDRIIMILAGSDTLRDVIAFPKTQKAACPMSEAPGSVDQQQLDDVHIALAKEDKAEE